MYISTDLVLVKPLSDTCRSLWDQSSTIPSNTPGQTRLLTRVCRKDSGGRSSLKAVAEVHCGSPVPLVQLGLGLGLAQRPSSSPPPQRTSALFWGQTRGFPCLLWQQGQGDSQNTLCLPAPNPPRETKFCLGSALNRGPVFLVLCSGRQEHVGGSWEGGGCWVEVGMALCPRPT